MNKRLLALLALLCSLGATAAEPLQIMELQWRSAEELLPILRPMAGDEASVSGSGYHLFLRAPHQRLQELKAMVLELDRAPRQMMISVFQGRLDASQRSTLPGPHTRRVQTRGHGDITQRIRVSEGQRAFIAAAKVEPLPTALAPTGPYAPPLPAGGYRETVSGFLVRPMLSGDRVSLEISTAHAAPDRLPEQQGSATRVLVKPGGWIALVGSSDSDQTHENRPTRRHSTQSRAHTGIFVKLELLPE